MAEPNRPLTTQQQADIILNRTNVALARSQRLIQSWLPSRPVAEDGESNPQVDEDGKDDSEQYYKGMTELGGLGANNAYGNDATRTGDTSLLRTKQSSNDQLLEKLLGKRMAQQHSKNKTKTQTPKQTIKEIPTTRPARRDAISEDSDEGEGGRASSFKSKRVVASEEDQSGWKDDGMKGEDEDGASGRDLPTRPSAGSSKGRTGKRKPTSYLDELLVRKASKKKTKRS